MKGRWVLIAATLIQHGCSSPREPVNSTPGSSATPESPAGASSGPGVPQGTAWRLTPDVRQAFKDAINDRPLDEATVAASILTSQFDQIPASAQAMARDLDAVFALECGGPQSSTCHLTERNYQ